VPADDTTLTLPLPLLTPTQFQQFALLSGRNADFSRGSLLSVVLDCDRQRSLGARLVSPNADPGSTIFYLIDALPNSNATQTESVGVAGILNLPLGTQLVEARRTSDDALINQANLYIRPNALTVIDFEPSP
jgi:hypothetical protein